MNDSPSEDVVEDFARQLEQVCSITPVHQTTHQQGSESDSESDNEIPFGYEQLAQEEDEGVSLTDEDEDDREPVIDLPQGPPTLSPLEKSEEISEDTANTIKSIMSKIQLSDQAVPEWAKAIPESMWMPRLDDSSNSSGSNGSNSNHEQVKGDE
ncbi:predicted protein [Lichtheimia corymbifera JMRC:FSU:9682]|uniref:Male-enhanced antigen 1 n=1 Tax=Lichtheimia corymbifera JMRC:FSU:9682 TaxID=1263082 RepID=A0A068RLT2_9FUNG|nr:predicted protein [Lichtheimia corymbifera JMRC:FSU:9682]